MNSILKWALSCMFAACLFPMNVRAEDKPETDAKDAKKDEVDNDQIEIYTGSKDDFDQVCKDAGVEGDQLAKIHTLAEKRIEKLKAWVQSEDGSKYISLRKQMASTRRDRSAQLKKTQSATQPVDFDTKIKEIRAEMQPLGKQYTDLRNTTRGDVLKELSPEQQSKAVTTNLGRRIGRMFEAAKLTDDQQAKVAKLVDASAAGYLKEHSLDQDPLMQKLLGIQNTLAKQIRDEVLTEEQRELLKKKKEPTTQKD